MSSIVIADLQQENTVDSSYLKTLSSEEQSIAKGGAFWFVLLGAAWLGYEIGKEAKTNWFK